MIVRIQQIERIAVFLYDRKHLLTIQIILRPFHNPYHFSKLFDAIIIHSITF